MINRLLQKVGSSTLALCTTLGIFTLFFVKSVKVLCTTRLKWHKLFEQINRIGVDSFYIVVLTGTFSGMVFALQSYIGFQRVGGEQFIGAVVALGMIRELGPVLTGLMVTGRAGSAIAAELGTMSISEQIDALVTLRINPFQYLIVPRILAGTMALPFLAIFSMICGIMGGYVLCVYILHLSPEDYLSNIKTYVELSDIKSGLIKASFFGLILSTVGAYKGYNTTGGAKGVGLSTTQSVVIASIFILISNYFLTKLLEHL